MRVPSSQTSPASAFIAPVTRLNSVVLPDPLGPISAVMLPAATVRSAPSTAVMPPNALAAPLTSSIGRAAGAAASTASETTADASARSRTCSVPAPSAPAWSWYSVPAVCRRRHQPSRVGSSPAGRNRTMSMRATPKSSTRELLPP